MRKPSLAFALGLCACGPTAPNDDAGFEGSGGEASSTGVVEEGSTGTPEALDVPATGLRITRISANQGVEVPVVVDDVWVDGAGRNAELIKERETLVRAFLAVDDDFEPRDIKARLTLTYPDGRTEQAEKTLHVERDSTDININSQAWFVLRGQDALPGVRFQFELLEADPTFGDETAPPHVYPAKPEYLGIEAPDMRLRVMLVPVKHASSAECPDAPVIDEAAIEAFRAALYTQNPVHEVEISVREPYVFEDDLSSFVPLLAAMAGLREEDGADPAYYYYGVVRPCDGGPSGVGGQAIDIPSSPTQANGWTRVAVGRWYSSLSSTTSTFVHEIGHVQGRFHIACNGSEGGTDPTYPYIGGNIGTWGFDVVNFRVHPPESAKDYMTYCGNTWISDWGWRKVVPFIREITSWESAGAQLEDELEPLLVGLFDPATGDESWFTTMGAAPDASEAGAERLDVELPGRALQLPLVRGRMGDGDAYSLVTPLPRDLDLQAVRRLSRRSSDGSSSRVRSIRTRSGTLAL